MVSNIPGGGREYLLFPSSRFSALRGGREARRGGGGGCQRRMLILIETVEHLPLLADLSERRPRPRILFQTNMQIMRAGRGTWSAVISIRRREWISLMPPDLKEKRAPNVLPANHPWPPRRINSPTAGDRR